MLSIVDYSYDDKIIENIQSWPYGTNWPVVYIYYNSTNAYVGESLDAVRRTEQHKNETQFDSFTNIIFISDKTFNKSVILDLESFLIKYISADSNKQLINGNAGIADHNYFYKEVYVDDFKDIWNILLKKGVVSKSLSDIENSELFKYSPFKSLTNDQLVATYEIISRLCEINNASNKSIIEVNGGAGTGKTILAVYIVKLLVDIGNDKKVWEYIDDHEIALRVERLAQKFDGVRKIGFVVPMNRLRETMKQIFKSIDGLSSDMVLAPEQVVEDYYDLLVVDESHRLYQRKNLPGAHLYIKFDKINRNLMDAGTFTGTAEDDTELDWVIKSSRMQILFYDEKQSIRATDIDKDRFNAICNKRLYKYINLVSQMRCEGGNSYCDYVKKVITSIKLTSHDYEKVSNYKLVVLDSIEDLFSIITKHDSEVGLCKVISGPGWTMNEDIVIDNHTYHWASGNKTENVSDTIFSIHKCQGFDLNYAGVIFGKEVYYDKNKGCIEVNKSEVGDGFVKPAGDDAMHQFIMNIYVTLMTRGIKGTYVYAVDLDLRNYLKQFFQ